MTKKEALDKLFELTEQNFTTKATVLHFQKRLSDYEDDDEVPQDLKGHIRRMQRRAEHSNMTLYGTNNLIDPQTDRRIDILSKKFDELQKASDPNLLENLGGKITQVEEFLKKSGELQTQKTEFQNQIDEVKKVSAQYIEETDKNKQIKLDTELGASFRDRKNELVIERRIMRMWLYGIYIVTGGATIFTLVMNTINMINKKIDLTTMEDFVSFSYTNFFVGLPFFVIIWFVIRYFVRRTNEYDHLIEEYANKQALSLSFERYKEAFKEIASETENWDALQLFTDSTAKELIKNPCHIFPKDKTDRIPINEVKQMFNLWGNLPESNQSALLEALKLFIEKNTELELDKRKRETKKIEQNKKKVDLDAPLDKYDPFDEDVPF